MSDDIKFNAVSGSPMPCSCSRELRALIDLVEKLYRMTSAQGELLGELIEQQVDHLDARHYGRREFLKRTAGEARGKKW